MPYQIRPSADGKIIYVVVAGRMDFESSPPVFVETAQWLERYPEAAILVDVREALYIPSVSDARHFVRRHNEITMSKRNPHALVTASGVNFGMAMMMSTLIEISGGKSQAFTDLEEAERWLLDELEQRSSSPRP